MTSSLRFHEALVGLLATLLLALPAAAQAPTASEAVAEVGGSEALAGAVAAAITEDHKLTASDAARVDQFGWSVSLSGDRALVGAYRADCAPDFLCGAAYVFDFDGTTWTETAKFTASDAGPGDQFGYFVSLSGDRALVGAFRDHCHAGGDCGSAYVFDFDGTMWTETKLTASDADRRDLFGQTVALAGDRALVGAAGDACAAGEGADQHTCWGCPS